MRNLDGRVAVITGGASGIGRALAARLSSEGMTVVIADRDAAALARAADELQATPFEVDVADTTSVATFAANVFERFGRVHLLCNNAGIGKAVPAIDQTLDQWRRTLDVNLWGVIHGLHHFVPQMLSGGDEGHVVNTASTAGLAGTKNFSAHSASKFAVVGISEALSAELADTRIGVSVLCPGAVDTPLSSADTSRGLPPGMIAAETVADAVVDGVRARRFWILTHPEILDSLESRLGDQRAATMPS